MFCLAQDDRLPGVAATQEARSTLTMINVFAIIVLQDMYSMFGSSKSDRTTFFLQESPCASGPCSESLQSRYDVCQLTRRVSKKGGRGGRATRKKI